jgi:hypothetical protein
VQLKSIKNKPRRAVINYFDDVLAATNQGHNAA